MTTNNTTPLSQPQGSELAGLIALLSKNRNAGIAELKKMESTINKINMSKVAMSSDKRAGFLFEEVVAGTYNAAARKAGDFHTTATTGVSGTFGNDPRVDIRVVRDGNILVEAQAKCCRNPARTAIEVSRPQYEGTARVVPAGQAKQVEKLLIDSAEAKATSSNPRMQEIGAARQEASTKVVEKLQAGGHSSKSMSHKEVIELAKGDTSAISSMILRETLTSAAVNGAKSGAAFSGAMSAATTAIKLVNGDLSASAAAKAVVTETIVGGARSAATALVAEGVKATAKKTLSTAAAGAILRGSGPMAVAGGFIDIVTDACKGELTAKSAAKSATRAAGGWAGAEGGAALGSLICPGLGTLIGGLIGGIGGSMLGGAW